MKLLDLLDWLFFPAMGEGVRRVSLLQILIFNLLIIWQTLAVNLHLKFDLAYCCYFIVSCCVHNAHTLSHYGLQNAYFHFYPSGNV